MLLCSTHPVFAEENINMTPYVRNLQQEIKAYWKTKYLKTTNYRVIAIFKVSKNGDLISSEILESTGNNFLDNAALGALEKAQPFQPFPPEFNHEDFDIKFTFDYKRNHKKFLNCRFVDSKETKKIYKNLSNEEKTIFTKEIRILTQIIYLSLPFEKYPCRQKIKISFILSKNGSISDFKIIKKSRNESFDNLISNFFKISKKGDIASQIGGIDKKLNLDQIKCTYEIISAVQD